MKTTVLFALALAALVLPATAQTSSSTSSPQYVVADRGPFWRTWQRTTHLTNYLTGATFDNVESYVELDNGACYQNPNGQWVDSRDLIEITPTGAAAVHGPIKAYFAPNINAAGAISLVTASGQKFKSHPIGLYYRDMSSGKVALIAPIQDTIGVLVPPNRVVFSNAFGGLRASVVYVCAHNGFDQSVVLSQAPPPPDLLAGFNSQTTRLEIWTALDQWPGPQAQREVTVKPGNNGQADLSDQLLFFADSWLPVGTAFSFGGEEGLGAGEPAQIRVSSPSDTNQVPVGKSIQQIGNDSVLVESVNYVDVQPQLKALQAAAPPAQRLKAKGEVAQGQATRSGSSIKAVSRPMELASLKSIPRGLLLDYSILPASSNSMTFSNGWTYFISSSFQVGPGTATFQPNSVVKYATNAYLMLYGPVSFPSTGSTMDTFTSADDNQWGAAINNSTGYPYYAAKRAIWMYYDANYTAINECRVRWSQIGIEEDENCGVYNYPTIGYTSFQECNTTLSANVCNDTLTVSHVTKCDCNGSSGYYSGTITTDCELNAAGPGFAGMNSSSYAPYTSYPDTDGAVGPTNFVEIINYHIAVYDKPTGTLLDNLDTTSFFRTTNNGTVYPVNGSKVYDPRVIYDQQSGAWLACGVESGAYQVMFAYKTGSSPLPLTNWTTEVLLLNPGGGYRSDSPTLGVDAHGVYISAVEFTNTIYTNLLACFPKPDVYLTNALPTRVVIVDTNQYTTKVQVAINTDSAGASTNYVWCIFKGWPTTGGTYTNANLYYQRLQWSGSNISWLDATSQVLSASSAPEYYDFDAWTTNTPNAPVGPGCSGSINFQPTGSRLHMATIRNGYLWTCQHVGLSGTGGSYTGNASGSTVDRSAVQWWKLQLGASGLTYVNSGMIYDNSTSNPWWYYMPSLAVNWQNQAIVGFEGSSAVSNVYAFYRGIIQNGTMLGANVAIQQGTACFQGTRWGDYTFTSVDPIDNQTIWTIQEFATLESGGNLPNWSDWIVSVGPGP